MRRAGLVLLLSLLVCAPAGASSVPDWFEENRVQAHTRLIVQRWYGTPEFAQAAEIFDRLGAKAFVRHVKTADEDPWWPRRRARTSSGRSSTPRMPAGSG